MKNALLLSLAGLAVALFLTGCGGHEPLPQLNYRIATPMSAPSQTPTSVVLESGEAVGHSLTSYALMPGGYAMPITSGPSEVTAFNTEDQAAFVQNLVRVLTERGVIRLTPAESHPAASLTLKFLKTEHFPEMQDYIVDALVSARLDGKTYEKVYHVSTIDSVNLVARMFQHPIDGRRRVGELLLAAIVPELEAWFKSPGTAGPASPNALQVARPFTSCAPGLVAFLYQHYSRPSTFWKGGINVQALHPSENVAVVELRWDSDALPPFCVVDIYGEGDATRITIRERDGLLTSKAHVAEAVQEFIRGTQSADTSSPSAEPRR